MEYSVNTAHDSAISFVFVKDKLSFEKCDTTKLKKKKTKT